MARILIVDADERFRSAYAEDLEQEGHEVLTAAKGNDALRLAGERPIDLVVTEVQLPGMDGLDLMNRLLARQRGLIVILNSDSPHYKDNFLSWAADACMRKSDGTLDLRMKVRELLRAKCAIAARPAGALAKQEETRRREVALLG